VPRKAKWPPQPYPHKSGLDRVRWKGEDYYTGPTGSEESKRNYAALLVRLQAGGEPPKPAPTPVVTAVVTVADVVARWMEEVAPSYSQEGREARQHVWACRPLLALYGGRPAAGFTALELEAVQLAMATGTWKEGEKGYCTRVVRQRLGRVRRIWRWAERKGHVPRGSWANLATVPPLRPGDPRVRRTTRRKGCSFADLLAVVKCAPRVVGHMLLLCWWSGMRPGEVRVLRASEVDATGPEWVYRPEKHKNAWRGQERAVVLGPRAQAVLGKWMASPGRDGFVFPPSRKRKGGRTHYSCGNFAKAVRKAAAKAGVKGVHAYLCRHSAKDRVTREQGLDAARAFLGQASLQSTAGYGEAADLELARRAARKLG
jgi:integrase